jgi:hypothetical protein
MKRILSYMIVTLLLAMCGLGAHAQSPQTGVYRIQNVGSKLYVKVTGKYAAEPNESAQAEASKITVGVAGVLDDGTYKMNSLASTYTTADGQTQSVEVYDYVTRAIHIGNAVLRQEIASSSDENKAKAEQAMDKFITDNAHMRLYPVAGKASTYRACGHHSQPARRGARLDGEERQNCRTHADGRLCLPVLARGAVPGQEPDR